MERPEDDAPLADDSSGPVPDDMPLERQEGDEAAAARPRRTERQEPEPKPPRRRGA
jgi:hypothetical protein